MHAVAHQITHQAMVAAVASAAAGNDLEGADWAVGRSSRWWVLSASRPASTEPSALFDVSVRCTGQQVPGFPTAPTRVVIARPTPPQARPSHPGGPPGSGALVSKGWGTYQWGDPGGLLEGQD